MATTFTTGALLYASMSGSFVWTGTSIVRTTSSTCRPGTAEQNSAARDWAFSVLIDLLTASAQAQAATPTAGKRVKSLTQRGKDVGITGTVLWLKENTFNPAQLDAVIECDGTREQRAILASRVAVIDATPRYTGQQIIDRAAELAYRMPWPHLLTAIGLTGIAPVAMA